MRFTVSVVGQLTSRLQRVREERRLQKICSRLRRRRSNRAEESVPKKTDIYSLAKALSFNPKVRLHKFCSTAVPIDLRPALRKGQDVGGSCVSQCRLLTVP